MCVAADTAYTSYAMQLSWVSITVDTRLHPRNIKAPIVNHRNAGQGVRGGRSFVLYLISQIISVQNVVNHKKNLTN